MFWAYLWGIETQSRCISWKRKQPSFEPTYEELKLCKQVEKGLISETFWAYLWGIETLPNVWQNLKNLRVLSLPMRNWNDYKYGVPQTRTHCFEPTYEELKLEHRAFFIWKEVWVLSLPMRNWNSLSFHELLFQSFSFEPTYEELKRGGKSVFLGCFCIVLSLPMRNWNLSLLITSHKSPGF